MKVKQLAFTALMAALCCILGPLSVPLGSVPVSLGVLAVYLAAYVLGGKWGSLSVLIYLLLGLAGLPVFSGFAGGPGKMLGPTGGFLIGFLFLAAICGGFVTLSDHRKGLARYGLQITGMILGLAVCYALGTMYFMFVMKTGLIAALAACVLPFLIFDALKMIMALILGNALRRALTFANLLETSRV